MTRLYFRGTGSAEPASDVINFRKDIVPAVAISTVNALTPTKPAIAPAVAIDATRQTHLTDQKPAFALSVLNALTPTKPAVNPALALSVVLTEPAANVVEAPALEMQRVQFNVDHRAGGTAQVVTGTAWGTPANALGIHNATLATIAGSLTAAVDGTLTLTYAAQANRGSLAITSVQAHFYTDIAITVLLGASVVLSYSFDGAAYTTLETILASASNLATPRTHAIPTTSWTDIANLRTRVRFASSIGDSASGVNLDAVEVQVVANHTMNL